MICRMTASNLVMNGSGAAVSSPIASSLSTRPPVTRDIRSQCSLICTQTSSLKNSRTWLGDSRIEAMTSSMNCLWLCTRSRAVGPATNSAPAFRTSDRPDRCRCAGRSARPAASCWVTWASSCASRRSPSGVPGAYCPVPNTTSRPTVYARARTSRADCAAGPPVCTRTRERSAPSCASNRPRTEGSIGLPLRARVLATDSGAGTSRPPSWPKGRNGPGFGRRTAPGWTPCAATHRANRSACSSRWSPLSCIRTVGVRGTGLRCNATNSAMRRPSSEPRHPSVTAASPHGRDVGVTTP